MKYLTYTTLGSLLVVAGAQVIIAGQASALAQTVQATPALEAMKLPSGTAFLAKLSTNLDGPQCKAGEPMEAEVKQDVKQGHDLLLKKGSVLLGHVAGVKAPTSNTPQLTVAIAFDSVRLKDGKRLSLNLIIQALAPEANTDSSGSLADFTGPGLTNADRTAGVSGHNSTVRGNTKQLSPASTGIYDLPGLALGDQTTDGKHYSTLAFATSDFRLKKGAQLVFKMVE
jgi:hypothetical protein